MNVSRLLIVGALTWVVGLSFVAAGVRGRTRYRERAWVTGGAFLLLVPLFFAWRGGAPYVLTLYLIAGFAWIRRRERANGRA